MRWDRFLLQCSLILVNKMLLLGEAKARFTVCRSHNYGIHNWTILSGWLIELCWYSYISITATVSLVVSDSVGTWLKKNPVRRTNQTVRLWKKGLLWHTPVLFNIQMINTTGGAVSMDYWLKKKKVCLRGLKHNQLFHLDKKKFTITKEVATIQEKLIHWLSTTECVVLWG